MQQSYLLSNKENDYSGDRPSYRLKMNYQQRQKHYERSKSPLGDNSNRFNFRETKDNFKVPLSSKRRDLSYNCADQVSLIQPFGQRNDFNNIVSHNNGSSVSDLSKIKPISLQNRKNQEALGSKTIEREPFQDKFSNNDYRTNYSKSAHRQNSKHLGFIAKVDNLQKINHQISHLLSYVNENKSAKKDIQIGQYSASSKPRYGIISQNSKSYQRKLNTLQKPKGYQPNISVFDPQNGQKRLTPSNKNSNQSFVYKDSLNKSVRKTSQDQTISRQNRSRTPKMAIRTDISPKNSQNTKISNNNMNISPLKTVKSQQFTGNLTPSQSLQKLSKITTGNNPDLEFYYESLKKRDQQVENFQKNAYDNRFQKNRQSSKAQNTNLKSIQNSLRNQFNKQKYLDKKCQDNDRLINLSKKDVFVTEKEVQVCKDISRLKNNENQRISSTKRIENLRAQIDRSENQRHSKFSQPFFPKKKQRTLSTNENLHKQIKIDEETYNNRPQKLNIQPDFCAKIQDQMMKIQNQMKDCENEKNFFRGKYSNLLGKEKSIYKEKTEISNSKPIKQIPQTKIDQSAEKFRQDRERMYDSSTKKAYASSLKLKLENDDQFHRDLRKRMINQNQTVQNDDNLQNASYLPEEKSFGQRNFSSKKIAESSLRTLNDKSFTYGFGQKLDLSKGYQADFSSYERSSKLQELRTPTNPKTDKKFEIMLQKVQITKPQTTKLGTLLSQKIELDMKLRQQREKFWKNKNSEKWQDLRQHLASRYGMSKTTKQWQELLSISPQEHNPFSPTQMSSKPGKNLSEELKLQRDGSTEQDILLLASLLAESLNYFDSQLLHNFSQQKLKKEHFAFRELDLSSKGFLSLEDLICFINLYSGKFYRNRDSIFLIKSIILFHKKLFQANNNSKDGIESYSSQKGGNGYRISYNFLWRIFTDKK